jgi:hypothetical protein
MRANSLLVVEPKPDFCDARRLLRSTMAVPRVGCPPNGISSFGQKILTLIPCSRSVCCVPRKDERGFLNIRLPCQVLHFRVAQTASIYMGKAYLVDGTKDGIFLRTPNDPMIKVLPLADEPNALAKDCLETAIKRGTTRRLTRRKLRAVAAA